MNKIILYVDDDIDDIQMLKECFDRIEGYELLGLQYGNLLFQKLNELKNTVCLIILDINMPMVNGVELLRQIKSNPEYSKLSVVMFSTINMNAEYKIISELGADIVLKPSTYQEMKDLAQRLLEYC